MRPDSRGGAGGGPGTQGLGPWGSPALRRAPCSTAWLLAPLREAIPGVTATPTRETRKWRPRAAGCRQVVPTSWRRRLVSPPPPGPQFPACTGRLGGTLSSPLPWVGAGGWCRATTADSRPESFRERASVGASPPPHTSRPAPWPPELPPVKEVGGGRGQGVAPANLVTERGQPPGKVPGYPPFGGQETRDTERLGNSPRTHSSRKRGICL